MMETNNHDQHATKRPSAIAADSTIGGTCNPATASECHRRPLGTARRHGVADSIRGFGSWTPVRIRVPLPVPNQWGMVQWRAYRFAEP